MSEYDDENEDNIHVRQEAGRQVSRQRQRQRGIAWRGRPYLRGVREQQHWEEKKQDQAQK